MNLSLQFTMRRGDLRLEVELDVAAGETVALVGPNGAGKTSCLLAIAGLLAIESGRISAGDAVFDDAERGLRLPAEGRGVGFVFQDHLLFPHLSALDNVAFGLRSRGVANNEALATARSWLARVGLADRAAAMPRTLSGGQAQRVALARALATSPCLLLLDEPLAAVDASARLELRRELRRHLEAFTGARLLVVHDAVDAFALADRIAVFEAGRIVQVGTVAEVGSRPRSRYVADLVGLNCFRGVARGGSIDLEGGGTLVVGAAVDGPVIATVHPRAVSLFAQRPAGSPRNVWSAPVRAIEPAIDGVRVQLGGGVPLVVEVTAAAIGDLDLHVGDDVWIAVKATEIRTQPA